MVANAAELPEDNIDLFIISELLGTIVGILDGEVSPEFTDVCHGDVYM